jgi:hypothetical protein
LAVELANKFGNAVAFANNQEIMQVHQEDQDIAVMCKLTGITGK